ncbi:MAG: FtsQ-type POTRA domain-containing protein [Oscillospiraceae bacterium]|nr:FtsQ-type POTRA domain-containing protein [Oscillospiraceae bacterium]
MKKNRKGSRPSMYIPIAALLIAILTIFGIGVFLVIAEVEVTGASMHTYEEIIEISGIVPGDNMILLDRNNIAQRIIEELPYINDARIHRVWPNTVRIEVTESMAIAAIPFYRGTLIVDSAGRVLEQRDEAPHGLVAVRGIYPTDPVPGRALTTEPDAAAWVNTLITMLTAIEEADIQDDVLELDITNPINITIRYLGRITVRLGGIDDIQNKLRLLPEAVEGLPPNQSGTFDMRDSSPANWRFQHN